MQRCLLQGAQAAAGVALVMLTGAALAQSGAQLGVPSGAPSGASVPPRDAVVETRLLPRAVKASVQRLAAAQASPAPASALPLSASLATVHRLLDEGRASGDPRTLGYAESVLARWPAQDASAPLEVLVLRAAMEQRRHRFGEATTLLDRVLARDPAHAQARLTRASIAQVRGSYAEAAADCAALTKQHAQIAAICTALNDAMTGREAQSAVALEAAAARTQGAVRAWALGARAQVAEQRGEPTVAAAAYRAALSVDDDLGTRLAYADLLIAQRDWSQAADLLKDAPPADGVLLRRWQVARARGTAEAPALQAQLEARFIEAQARGDLLHAREAAQFALDLGDPSRALQLAQLNWRSQREAADLLLLARAARASADAAALRDLRDWVARTGFRDQRLAAVLQGAPA